MADKESAKCIKCGCTPNRDNVKLFLVPKPGLKNNLKCAIWAKFIHPENEQYASTEFQMKLYRRRTMICSRHFSDEDFADCKMKTGLARYACPVELAIPSEANESMATLTGQEEWLSEGVMTDEDFSTSHVSSQDPSQDSTQQHNDEAQVTSYVNETINQGGELSIEITPLAQPTEQTEATDATDGNVSHVSMEESAGHDVLQAVEETLNNLDNSGQDNSKEKNDLLDELNTFLIRKSDKAASEDKGSNERSALNSGDDEDDDGHNTDELLEMLGEDDDAKGTRPPALKMISKKASLAAAETSDEDVFHDSVPVKTLKLAKNAVIKRYTVPKDEGHYNDSDMSSDEASNTMKTFKPTKKLLRKSSTPASKSLLRVNFGDGKKTDAAKSHARPGTQPRTISMQKEHSADETAIQRLRRPETMDEEMPSEIESADDDSIFDDLPSSESEGTEDWFTIDVRAERAGEYIPLLGSKGRDLLTEERRRMTSRLAHLRNGLRALDASTRENLAEIERARRKIDELDGQLSLA